MNWKGLYSERVDAMGHSDVVEMLKMAEKPEVISFAGGLPDPNIFLLDEIREAFEAGFQKRARLPWDTDPPTASAFREWLAESYDKLRQTLEGR
jgi:DNA-binding transcriptional MocR family regulator